VFYGEFIMRSFRRARLLALSLALLVVIPPVPAVAEPSGRAAEAPARTAQRSEAAGPRAAEPAPGPVSYAYDAAGRLVGATQPGGEAAVYDYDAAGNMLGVTRLAAGQLKVMSVVPVTAKAGQTVRLHGTGFAATPAANAVTFNGVPATVTKATPTELTVTVPEGAVGGQVDVTVAGATASGGTFTAAAPGPAVTALSPASGPATTIVTATGRDFAAEVSENVVSVNGYRATVTAVTATSLTFEVPQGATTGKVTVSTPSGESRYPCGDAAWA
jgi:YD repeat-containing protein